MVQIEPSTTHRRPDNYTRHTLQGTSQGRFHEFGQFWGHLHTIKAICDLQHETVDGVHFKAIAPNYIEACYHSRAGATGSDPEDRRSQEHNSRYRIL